VAVFGSKPRSRASDSMQLKRDRFHPIDGRHPCARAVTEQGKRHDHGPRIARACTALEPGTFVPLPNPAHLDHGPGFAPCSRVPLGRSLTYSSKRRLILCLYLEMQPTDSGGASMASCGMLGTNVGRPAALSQPIWRALTTTYVETADLRHSLVHRTVYTDPSGALIGVDRARNPLRPLSVEEQEAFGRVALRAVQVVTAQHADPRIEADLIGQLVACR
jgi:hypothetical protein